MRVLLFFVLVTSGCKTAEPIVSEPEFMTFPQDDPHMWILTGSVGLHERILIKRVHDKSWNIDYGFAPNCNDSKREQYRPEVEDAIRRAVNLWLDPIRAMQKAIKDGKFSSDPIIDPQKQPPELVSQLHIHEKKEIFAIENSMGQEAYATYDPQILKESDEVFFKLPELSVVFNCGEGRAFMKPYENRINIYNDKNKLTSIPETKLSFAALLHEIGHTFGLADTYTDPQHPARGHMVSTGIHPGTVGHQPISVMSLDNLLGFASYKEVKPTVDDRNGIFWLYAHMHMNKLNLGTCPPGYQTEIFTRDDQNKPPTIACRPNHSLLFAMASRNYSTARYIINSKKERESIDINARTHEQGFTALHYAVLFAPTELVKTILDHFHQEIDFSIAGFHMKEAPPLTALQVAETLLKDAQQKNHQQSIERYSTIVDLFMNYIEA